METQYNQEAQTLCIVTYNAIAMPTTIMEASMDSPIAWCQNRLAKGFPLTIMTPRKAYFDFILLFVNTTSGVVLFNDYTVIVFIVHESCNCI